MKKVDILKQNADIAKVKYMQGMIDMKEAKHIVGLFIEEANNISKRIAKEHGVSPRLMNISSYLR